MHGLNRTCRRFQRTFVHKTIRDPVVRLFPPATVERTRMALVPRQGHRLELTTSRYGKLAVVV